MIPLWAYALAVVTGFAFIYILWTVLSGLVGTLITLAVVVVFVGALYYAYRRGYLESFLQSAKQHPERYVPVALIIIFSGAYLAYFASQQPFIDLNVVIQYKVVPGEGVIGALIGAKIDPDSIRYQASVTRAYWELPFLVKTQAMPECEDGPGPGYYLKLYVPETEFVCYMPFRYVNAYTRYLLGGTGVDMFMVYGVPLSGDLESHSVTISVLRNGREEWSKVIYVLSGTREEYIYTGWMTET